MVEKHTPGPWDFRLEAVRTVIFHKADIGEKAIAVGAGSYPDHIANARLIAAAPDLLEALKALRGNIGCASLVRNPVGIKLREQADAAIAKAVTP